MARRSLEQKLSPMALRFATQIARVVQQDTRRAIAAEVKARLRSLKVGAGTSGSTTRSTRKIVVECPAPGCKNQGVRTLIPSIADVEEVFLAALSIGNPGLPLSASVKQLVVPIARAIEPILEPSAVDRLRGHFLRFVEEGGRTNLHRWAASVHKTAARTGLLLSNDLAAAESVLAIEDPAHVEEKMNDLIVFATSDRYARLRKQLGIAVESQ